MSSRFCRDASLYGCLNYARSETFSSSCKVAYILPPISAGVTDHGGSQQTATEHDSPGLQDRQPKVPSLGQWSTSGEAEQMELRSRVIPARPAEVGSLLLSAVWAWGATDVAVLCARLYSRTTLLELTAAVQHLFQEASERFSREVERSEALEWARGTPYPRMYSCVMRCSSRVRTGIWGSGLRAVPADGCRPW
jgi:hypothetical protein